MDNVLEGIDYSVTLAPETPGMLLAGGILALSVFIVMFIVIKKRWKGRVLPFFLALVTFTFVRIFAMLAESALMLVPSIDAAFEYNPSALTVVDVLLSAVGYVAARWVVSNILIERFERQGDVLLAGLGLGFGDAMLFGFTLISNYVWCIAVDTGSLAQAFEGLTESEALTTYLSLQDLFYAPAILWLLMGVSTVIDMVLHILLTMVIFGVAKKQVPSVWHAICAVIYIGVIIPFQMYDYTSITSIMICFAVKLVIFAAAAYYISKNVFNSIRYEE